MREIREALNSAFEDPGIKAVILTGSGKNFTGGADITEIQQIKDRDLLMEAVMENNRFLNSIEEGPKPVIVAINGNCMGGGLEIAMASHYRIAVKGVQVGQPEVKVGLIPGAGGDTEASPIGGSSRCLKNDSNRRAHLLRRGIGERVY